MSKSIDLNEPIYDNDDLLLVGTPEIEIPNKMLYINKSGKEQIINTITKNGQFAKRNSKSIITLNPIEDNVLKITNQGNHKLEDTISSSHLSQLSPILHMSNAHVMSMRDKTIETLQKQIGNRKQLLLNNTKKLSQIMNENEYLSEIADDYQKYLEYIKEQKEGQVKAFDLIYKYLEKIIQSNNLTETEMNNATREQRDILEKINNIKGELDDVINEHK